MPAFRSLLFLSLAVVLGSACVRADEAKAPPPGPGTPVPQEAPKEYMMGPSIFQEGFSPAGMPVNKKGVPRPMLRKQALQQAKESQAPAPASAPQSPPSAPPQSGK